VTVDRVAPHAMSSSPLFPQKMTSVFISSTHAFYCLLSKPFRAYGTLSYNSHPQNRIPLHFVYMILKIAEIKKINRSQLEALERKGEKRKQKQKGCFNSVFSGRRDMVVGLGGISANKNPGLASSLAAPCRPCL